MKNPSVFQNLHKTHGYQKMSCTHANKYFYLSLINIKMKFLGLIKFLKILAFFVFSYSNEKYKFEHKFKITSPSTCHGMI